MCGDGFERTCLVFGGGRNGVGLVKMSVAGGPVTS